MTDTEKIRKLAWWAGLSIRVVGKCFNKKYEGKLCVCRGTEVLSLIDDWSPLTNPQDSRMLLRKAQERGYHYEIGDNHIHGTYCLLYTRKNPRREFWGFGKDEEEAICGAILKLMEGGE